MGKNETRIITLRMPKKVCDIYDNLHPNGAAAAMRDTLHHALFEEGWFNAQIQELQNKINILTKYKEISPFAQCFEFSEEIDKWLMGHYTTAARLHQPEILTDIIYKAFNNKTGLKCSQKTYKDKILPAWLKKHNLVMPENK